MSFRKILFWIHLIVGCVMGLVVLMMSFTGVLLTYEHQMIAWAERGYHSAPPSPDAERLPLAGLMAKVADSGEPPSTVTWEADPTAPVTVSWGRSKTLYVNAYTGEVVGEGEEGVRNFFREVTAWHRWFAAEGEGRAFWKGVTGASNLGFLFLIVSGMYLWLPKKWTSQSVRAVAWFRGGLAGKARDFNWHNVFGIWCAVPLFFIVATATFFSYQWPTKWLYQAVEGAAPPPRGGPGGGRPEEPPQIDPAAFAGVDALLAKVEQANPGWETIALATPRKLEGPVSFTVSSGGRGRPDLRKEVELDRESGAVVKTSGFADQSPGRRARTWVRWIHTGEVGGWIGQTIAGVASFAGVMLVWTGMMLSWRRFTAWRARRA